MRPVFSSHIQAVDYDDAQGALIVAYTNGKRGVYQGVPADVADKVVTAPSIGTAIHSLVRGRYEFQYEMTYEDQE